MRTLLSLTITLFVVGCLGAPVVDQWSPSTQESPDPQDVGYERRSGDTDAPTAAPTSPTATPTDAPTAAPTDAPTATPTATPTYAPFRLNAFNWKMTLTNPSYPITQAVCDGVGKNTNAVSLRVFGEGQLADWYWNDAAESKSVVDMLTVGTGGIKLPTMPDSALKADRESFWDEFNLITDLQHLRRQTTPRVIMAKDLMDLPTQFQDHTMEEGAQAVRADFPTRFPTILTEKYLSEGVAFDTSIVPHATLNDFVNGPVMLARIIGWAVSEVSPIAFGTKWHEGRPRPEEVAWGIKERDARINASAYADGANITGLDALNITDDYFSYTAYANGAPRHPSWPAMHSAASSSSVYLATVLDLTPSQLREAQLLDCAVATFRSYAGVHYESDNMAGLSIGQEVLRRALPDFLHKNYGSNKTKVTNKLNSVILAHDWRTRGSCLKARDQWDLD